MVLVRQLQGSHHWPLDRVRSRSSRKQGRTGSPHVANNNCTAGISSLEPVKKAKILPCFQTREPALLATYQVRTGRMELREVHRFLWVFETQ